MNKSNQKTNDEILNELKEKIRSKLIGFVDEDKIDKFLEWGEPLIEDIFTQIENRNVEELIEFFRKITDEDVIGYSLSNRSISIAKGSHVQRRGVQKIILTRP